MNVRKAARHIHHAQRCNKRRNIEFRNDKTIDHANQSANQNRDQHHHRNAEIQRNTEHFQRQSFLQKTAGNHSSKAYDRTDRKIDSSGNNYIGHTNRKDSI